MAIQEYQEYLAAQVLNDGKPITYRLLSRAVKVHSNSAKQMLFEFHRSQNRRKPGSVHATYLVTGIRKPLEKPQTNGSASNHEDAPMSDDVGISSSLPQPDDTGSDEAEATPVTTMTLVQEQDLQDVKTLHESIDSVHVYSIQPTALEDVQVLSDCTRRLTEQTASENALEAWKQYGSIHNPLAKRRAGGRPSPAPKPQVPMTAGMKPAAGKPPALTKSNSSSSVGKDSAKTTSNEGPAPKRQKSDLFKSFAKSQAPKEKAAENKDETMMDADDEEDETFAKLPEKTDEAKAKSEQAKREKQEREETLRKMMEQDEDEEQQDSESEVPAVDKAAEDFDPYVEMAEADAEKPTEPQPEQATTVTANGRRRGRRKVMKKKTTKDAEGFLVTKQEEAWESFSEDDKPAAAAPAKKASTGAARPMASNADKSSHQAPGKKGQGTIMNFFQKK